jgi:hypothetical protein
MLGGAHDEVVPRSQMQELWAIIRNRGRDTAAKSKKPPAGGAAGVKAAAADDDDEEEDEDEKGENGSGSPAPGPGSGDRKAPPRVVVDGRNRYIEFADGTHSENIFSRLRFVCLCVI